MESGLNAINITQIRVGTQGISIDTPPIPKLTNRRPVRYTEATCRSSRVCPMTPIPLADLITALPAGSTLTGDPATPISAPVVESDTD